MYLSNIPGDRGGSRYLDPKPITHFRYAFVQIFFGLYASVNANLARLTQSNLVVKHGATLLAAGTILAAVVVYKIWIKVKDEHNRLLVSNEVNQERSRTLEDQNNHLLVSNEVNQATIRALREENSRLLVSNDANQEKIIALEQDNKSLAHDNTDLAEKNAAVMEAVANSPHAVQLMSTVIKICSSRSASPFSPAVSPGGAAMSSAHRGSDASSMTGPSPGIPCEFTDPSRSKPS